MTENKIGLNAFALIGFILGLLSVILYWLLGIIPVSAIIFSIIGLISIKKTEQKGKELAIAGLILGIIFTMQFGLKIFLTYNNYFQDNNSINTSQKTQVNNNIITKSDIIGTWQYFESNETALTDERIQLKENNTFLYSTLLHLYGNDEQPFHAEFIGTYTFSDNIITINLDYYTEHSNPEWANFFIGRTESFKYENDKLISMQGDNYIFEKK